MSRLLALWEHPGVGGSDLEQATRGMVAVWRSCLRDVDSSRPETGQAWLADVTEVARSGEWSRAMVGVVDDTVSWMLGNRQEAAVLVDNSYDEIVTVGELLDRVAMLTVMLDTWRPELGRCPLAPAFVDFGRRYETLAAGLNAGTHRQPRRRSQGLPRFRSPNAFRSIRCPRCRH
ncbi:hypothetical protein [Nocardia carnea]|uniref:hypothetical protein n=1 Tax=Nocardia carnea TaxID=37328 RepID=UPI002458634E|nr:hypothetical protein [Nocardia carnea]